MLSTRHRVQLGATLVGGAAVLLTGCASGAEKVDKAEVTPGKAEQGAPSAQPPAAAPDNAAIGVSPGGVTTRVDEPAQSTEEQYAQSCLATKAWMDAKGGDPQELIEPYLKDLQASKDAGPSTFNKTWADLRPAQQSAVIIAVQAAADGGC
jgi:hypothetical protein